MRSAPFALAFCLALIGCVDHAARPSSLAPVGEPRTHRALPAISIERADAPAAAPESHDDPILVALKSAVVQTGTKSVGSSSIVLKLQLDSGLAAAFKPESKKHHARWRAEVAAYRLARALGLDHVAPSVPRAVKLSALMASTHAPKVLKVMREGLVARALDDEHDDEARVPGAMIAWLPGLERLPLEHEPLWSAWGEWLSQTPPKRGPLENRLPKGAAKRVAEARALAPQISTMVAFDHLTGNRDRWSGHNVLLDMTHTRLIFLDNNLAFDATLDHKSTLRRAHVLARVERFSRALIEKMRALDQEGLRAIFGHDDRDAPLLDDAQIAACLARRDELVARVDALVTRFGEAAVLAYE